MATSIRARVLDRIRRFTRRALDRLDPPDVEAVPSPAPAPTAPLPRRTPVSVHPEATPNPNAMKFTLSPSPGWQPARSMGDAVAAASDPLGRALFAVDGVASLFAVDDFVTVVKDPAATWDELLPRLEEALRATL